MLRTAGCLILSCAAILACQPVGSGTPLVLLISVDTLRADRLGPYGSDRSLTPRIDSLAEDSQIFTAAYASSSHTLPSMASVLTGRYPEEIGVWSNESAVPESVSTLAESFQEAGWRTQAVIGNWILRRSAGLARGFDVYDDELLQRESARSVPERIGSETTRASLAALDQCSQDEGRCFLWVHYQDPHGPYTPPEAATEAILKRERSAPDGERVLPVLSSNFGLGGIPNYQALADERQAFFYRAQYDAEVAYMDSEVGRLLDGVASRGLLDEAIIIFTADHGESLGEDDYWFSHGETLTDPQVRVPLLIRIPGLRGARRPDVVSHVDLHATLLDTVLGQNPDPDRAGRSLFAAGAAELNSTAFMAALRGSKVARYGIVEGRFKFLVTKSEGVWQGRLSARDVENVDLSGPAPHVAAKMRTRLEEMMHRYQKVPAENLSPTLESDRQRLQALGYVDDAESY